MKKFLALVMAAALTQSLAACGGGNTSTPAASTPAASTPAASTPAAPAASTPNEPANTVSDFKVGAIYINSKSDTAGYTYAHHNGITKAMQELGMDVDKQLVIVDNVPDDNYDGICTAIDTRVGEAANQILGIAFGYLDAMADKAAEYPEVAFSHGTGFASNETNFNTYVGRIYQARYLAGVAAGL